MFRVNQANDLPGCPVCGHVASEWECKTEYGKPDGWTVACLRNKSLDHEVWVSGKTRRKARAMWRRAAK